MKMISFELVNGYVQGWHEVVGEATSMFEYIWEFHDVEGGKTDSEGNNIVLSAEEQLQHFSDNYPNYTFRDGHLFFFENNKDFERKAQTQDNTRRLFEIKEWFAWYDIQVAQNLRAQRTGTEWHAIDGERAYYSLAELDVVANEKQNQIRNLKLQG